MKKITYKILMSLLIVVMVFSFAACSGFTGQNGSNGTNGKSAYEIWLDEGNEGTETEFLDWLKGASDSNANGKSAYQIWLDEGNDGTEAEFLDWLKGASGTNGSNGSNGKSAFELFKLQYPDYPDNEAQWIDDLINGRLAAQSKGTQGLSYTPINGNAEYSVSAGTAAGLNIIIPSYYNGKPVTQINTNAFYNKIAIKSITIPTTVRTIQDQAFRDCTALEHIIFEKESQLFEVGRYVFMNCESLKEVVFPESVTIVGAGIFAGCAALESITVPYAGGGAGSERYSSASVLGYLFGTYDFPGALKRTVSYPVDPALNLGFGGYWYYGYFPANLKTVNITKADVIRQGAFEDLDFLETITIPDKVTSIERSAFGWCYGLKNFKMPSQLKEIGLLAFAFCRSFQSINIPADVTSIGIGAFENCSAATGIVKIPAAITELSGTFEGCELLSVVFFVPNSRLQTVGDRTFYNCKNLLYINLPDSITTVGDRTFYNCDKLQTEIYNGNLRYFGNILLGVTDKNVTSVSLKPTTTEIHSDAFSGCTNLSDITLPQSVKRIGSYAFYNSGLTNIVIPHSVTQVGSVAFGRCLDLTSVTFENNSQLETINSTMFTGSGITSIEIPNSVKTLASGAFANCKSLESITFEADSRLETIGNNAFMLTAITQITIPASVTSIGSNAFMRCLNLTTVALERSIVLHDGITEYYSPSSGSIFGVGQYAAPIANIYVSDTESLAAYQAANVWSDYADLMSVKS